MKKFNLVLLVLVAVLFGSGLVACSNGYSGGLGVPGFETPKEVTANLAVDGTAAKFIPFSGYSTVDEIKDQLELEYGENQTVSYTQDPLDFNLYFGNDHGSIVREELRNNNLYHNNDYIILRYDNTNELYKLEITDGSVNLISVPNPGIVAR